MKILKRDYVILVLICFPLLSLVLQQISAPLVIENQFLFACFNILSLAIAIYYTIQQIIKKNTEWSFSQKIIMLFGFVYTVLIVLITVSLILYSITNK